MRRGLGFLLAFAALVFVGLLGAGCYKPDVANGGYACTPDRPDCPSGYVCVANRCVDEKGPLDLGVNPPPLSQPDLATPADIAGLSVGPDLASSDMAGQIVPPDMTKPV